MSEQLWYYIDGNEAQIGPITIPELQELVANEIVTHETVVWTEALGHQWIPASNVEGLFEVPAEVAPAPVATAAPALRAPQPTAVAHAQPAQPTLAPTSAMIPSTPTTQPVVPAAAGAIAGHDPYATPGADPQGLSNLYPKTIQKGGSFMLWMMLFIIGAVLIIFAGVSTFKAGMAGAEVMHAGGSEEAAVNAAAAGVGGGLLLMLIAGGLFLTSGILSYIYLYRAWAALQPGGATISPGKAIGFMFIPLFNIVWLFLAVGGLPKQWNSITSRYDNTRHAPQITMGMFVCLLLLPVIGAILWHKQLINAINFMAKVGQDNATPAQGGFQQQAAQAQPQSGFSALGGAAPVAQPAPAAQTRPPDRPTAGKAHNSNQ